MPDHKPAAEARSEQTIFDELERLCALPGYVHAIAYFCHRDNVVRYSEEVTTKDMEHLFSEDRLIRTEIASLVGLMLKNGIDFRLPNAEVIQGYIEKTEALLAEMHVSMAGHFWKDFGAPGVPSAEEAMSHFGSGAVLREAIFYGGESAYSFQYRELAVEKYSRDVDWLRANKGFDMHAARGVAYGLGRLLDDKATATLKGLRGRPLEQWTLLPAYTFTVPEIASRTSMPVQTIENVLTAFVVPDGERNDQFKTLHDFNVANACPVIRGAGDDLILLGHYDLVQALYESPFYWMQGDSAYSSAAMEHRGQFTEEFSTKRLVRVFGKGRVFPNVVIVDSRGQIFGEIDVLVVFGDRAIVLQAKSKRLRIESRRGNDGTLRDDFKKAIQDSCDQGYRCAGVLGDQGYTLKDRQGRKVAFEAPPRDVYVLCVVADHYPALSFQSRQFLKYSPRGAIAPPFVLDVFTLDAMTEFLDSPLQLLSYIGRRSKYADKLLASHELTILSYHLKRNLWLGDEFNMVMLHDDISADLDIAMMVRREGVPGKDTPDGILTRFKDTTLGRFVAEIERRPDAGTISLGYMLLTLGEDTVVELSKGIDLLAQRARAYGRAHDLTISLDTAKSGFTVHCNDDPVEIAGPALERHCHARKYIQRAETWFGVCVRPSDESLRFGVSLGFPWEQNDQMDSTTAHIAAKSKGARRLREALSAIRRKVGRNEPCPCGSGKKYKKCCLGKESSGR